MGPWRKERYKSSEGFLSETGANPSNLQDSGGLYNSCADYFRTWIVKRTWNQIRMMCFNSIAFFYHGSTLVVSGFKLETFECFFMLEEMIQLSFFCFHCGHGTIPVGPPGSLKRDNMKNRDVVIFNRGSPVV